MRRIIDRIMPPGQARRTRTAQGTQSPNRTYREGAARGAARGAGRLRELWWFMWWLVWCGWNDRNDGNDQHPNDQGGTRRGGLLPPGGQAQSMHQSSCNGDGSSHACIHTHTHTHTHTQSRSGHPSTKRQEAASIEEAGRPMIPSLVRAPSQQATGHTTRTVPWFHEEKG